MDDSTLKTTTEEIIEQCPRFRILLVGKSGVGKSALINHAFNVDIASVSHREHGLCNIEDEIISEQNPRFVLHDSQGFEAGETDNLGHAKNFVQSRSGSEVGLKEKIHAIWLCVIIPHAGGRVFESGDEDFLRFAKTDVNCKEVPIVVVFTQFDRLVGSMEEKLSVEGTNLSEDESFKLCLLRANDEFKKICLEPLRKVDSKLIYAKTSVKDRYRDTLANLINRTQTLVEQFVEGDVWIVSAMAQRASAQAKIDSSIQVGMKQYWQSLAASTKLVHRSLKQCLNTLHRDIVFSWNFSDPDNLLTGNDFQDKIMALAQLVIPEHSVAESWFSNADQIQSMMGITTVIAVAGAPAVAAIGLSLVFLRWINEIYQQTPEVLRCLMGYIVDLTLVMDQLFLNTLPSKPPRLLTQEQIDEALEDYKYTEGFKVHRAIREYAQKSTLTDIVKSNNAQEKMIELIRLHRPGSNE